MSIDFETSFLLDLLNYFWYLSWSLKNFSVFFRSKEGDICWFCILSNSVMFSRSISFIWRFLKSWFSDFSLYGTARWVRLGSNALWNILRAVFDLLLEDNLWSIPAESLLPFWISANLETSLLLILSYSWKAWMFLNRADIWCFLCMRLICYSVLSQPRFTLGCIVRMACLCFRYSLWLVTDWVRWTCSYFVPLIWLKFNLYVCYKLVINKI